MVVPSKVLCLSGLRLEEHQRTHSHRDCHFEEQGSREHDDLLAETWKLDPIELYDFAEADNRIGCFSSRAVILFREPTW
jgi:hypothetical protein